MATVIWIGGSGSQPWTTTSNWSTGSVPVTGDTVYINAGASNINSGLSQSAVTLASLNILAGFTGTIVGLNIGFTAGLFSAIPASGSAPSISINAGSVQFGAIVINTAGWNNIIGQEPLQLVGSNSSNTLDVLGGTVGVATTAGSTATLSALIVGGTGTVVNCGTGLTLTTATVNSASALLSSAMTMLNVGSSGQVTAIGSGLIGTANVAGRLVASNRPGSGDFITTANIWSPGGVVDCSRNPVAGTIGTVNMSPGAQIITPNADAALITLSSIVFANGAGTLAAS